MPFISPFTGAERFGTDADDIMVSGLANDTLIGGEGNDTLFGTFGENVLNGGLGDDLLVDGLGDDVMIGSAGNDVLRSAAGDDTMDGGAGDDIFFVGGALPGGTVLISDLAGNDTLDAFGSSTSAIIDLTPGATSYIDGRQIFIEGGETTIERPLDLVLLQDLSGSYSDDLGQMRLLVDDLVARIALIASDSRLAATSFVDKPTSPFGDSGDYEYLTDLALTDDFDAFTAVVNSWATLYGADGPEAQLSGLLQVAVRAEEIGWRSDSVKVVVLTTDAGFHLAGDHSDGIPANNGDGVLDGTPPGAGEDYPTVAQVRDALVRLNIIPVFAITDSAVGAYESLVAELGFGVVVPLEGDSSNILQVFEDALIFSTTALIENARGGDLDDDIRGNVADNLLSGRDGNDTLIGRDGEDTLAGGEGNDVLSGGNDNDVLYGNDGNDSLSGNNGEDTLSGGNGNDFLSGGNGDDSLIGGNGNDRLFGINGNDVMDGGAGEDNLSGGAGDDLLYGGSGEDEMNGGSGNDYLDGGTGNDEMSGSLGDDYLYGATGNDQLSGGSGNDTLIGGTGQDVMRGGADSDTFVFYSLSDSPSGTGSDRITDFAAGVDHIDLSALGLVLSFVAGFTGVAGEVTYDDLAGRLDLDADGDSVSDFSINFVPGDGLTVTDMIF